MNVLSAKIRPPAVAGTFYPASPVELRQTVETLLASARPAPGPAPKALIAPHAGYAYSGPVAASAYIHWQAPLKITRVVLVGPAHRAPVAGLALPEADEFSTPLGTIPLDQKALARILHLPQVKTMDQAHRNEHSLEVQLPFLQVVLGEFSLVPLAVGWATDREVEEVLEKLWDGKETGLVISSDLSHDLDYFTAKKADESTSLAIEKLCPEKIGPRQACGHLPIRGLLRTAKKNGFRAQRVDVRNSRDTFENAQRVVGYGAYVFTS